jgi:hypothetical protein
MTRLIYSKLPIVFTTSWLSIYDPTKGNLLIDIQNESGSRASLLSGSSDYGDGASRVSGSLLNSFGSPDTGAEAIQAHYIPKQK